MTKPQPAVASSPEQMFVFAATMARSAPSIFNTQPWRWQINLPVLRLYADRNRQLMVADPDGRMLTVSCGAALHHARVALAVSGCLPEVHRLPDPDDPDLLAEIRVIAGHSVSYWDVNAFCGIGRRHTDRRTFTDQPVEPVIWQRLSAAAEREDAHLHHISDDQLAILAIAAAQADILQLSDPDYRMELAGWTHRPAWAGDGVDPRSAAPQTPRRVPVRDFAPFETHQRPDPGSGTNRGAVFGLIFTDDDSPLSWLRAGEALSAVLLQAASAGLATAPISDVAELPLTREQLRLRVLAGIGYPQIAVRVGYPAPGSTVASVRRGLAETIDIESSKEAVS